MSQAPDLLYQEEGCTRRASAFWEPARWRSRTKVRWAGAVLPPGSYSRYMDSIKGPLTIYDASGRVRARVYGTVQDPLQSKPAALLVTREGTERTVRSLNCPDWGVDIVYKPFTRAEKALLADGEQMEGIGIPVASR